MRQSPEPLPNFTHFQREDGLGDFLSVHSCFMVHDVVATLIVDIGSCVFTACFTGLVKIQFVLCSLQLFLVSGIIVVMDMAALMFLHTAQWVVSSGTSYASVYGALRGLQIVSPLYLSVTCSCYSPVQ